MAHHTTSSQHVDTFSFFGPVPSAQCFLGDRYCNNFPCHSFGMPPGVIVIGDNIDGEFPIATHVGAVLLHFDAGITKYYIQDLRTHEVAEVLRPPVGQSWVFEMSEDEPPYAFFKCQDESHWVTMQTYIPPPRSCNYK